MILYFLYCFLIVKIYIISLKQKENYLYKVLKIFRINKQKILNFVQMKILSKTYLYATAKTKILNKKTTYFLLLIKISSILPSKKLLGEILNKKRICL